MHENHNARDQLDAADNGSGVSGRRRLPGSGGAVVPGDGGSVLGVKFGSVCSGIEAASAAWAPLGWQAQFLSEIEAFPRAVLKYRHPGIPLHGDFTTIQAGDYGSIDLLVGGTPCQSFSIAGLRKGMADDRGNLALEYLRLADRLRPKWLVWENVPGVLSSNGGRDFGSFLGGLGELGYGFAYRVLDAQFFGLAQRRKRVFVVGHLGDWRRAAAVLFEPASLRGDPAPRREAGQDAARRLTRGSGGGQRYDGESETFVTQAITFDTQQITSAANRTRCEPGIPVSTLAARSRMHVAHTLRGEDFDASEGGTGRGTPIVPVNIETLQPVPDIVTHASTQEGNTNSLLLTLREAVGAEAFAEWRLGVSDTLQSSQILRSEVHGCSVRCQTNESRRGLDDGTLSRETRGSPWAVSDLRQAGRERRAPHGRGLSEQFTSELDAALSQLSFEGTQAETVLRYLREASEGPRLLQSPLPFAQRRAAVRRLTPREAERLQGFDDDYTLIPWRKGMAPDGPRYKALGNSMAVPVMRWIGERIAMVEAHAASMELAA